MTGEEGMWIKQREEKGGDGVDKRGRERQADTCHQLYIRSVEAWSEARVLAQRKTERQDD